MTTTTVSVFDCDHSVKVSETRHKLFIQQEIQCQPDTDTDSTLIPQNRAIRTHKPSVPWFVIYENREQDMNHTSRKGCTFASRNMALLRNKRIVSLGLYPLPPTYILEHNGKRRNQQKCEARFQFLREFIDALICLDACGNGGPEARRTTPRVPWDLPPILFETRLKYCPGRLSQHKSS